ncbi:MAG TPA: Eco29kI family restriction endonuclease [Syntrophales bacterium]|nr:Eco29kI family restriction endonuclease [Syntrophales bacterium]HOS76416.1 Eco29kI family restriction endonuclease [Syntrophales bacterium]HPB70485.1 Eco29kI family restriction endonuclease [Syntrophales bacterium]HQN25751.1 Eco29kI family restriction endonuclease [Syntrophales bacterium]HQP29143.1 Eco29kI family restriction endonuclease [Syntrophales bacterium]
MAKQPKRIPPFNPLDKTNLGESVAEAMLQQKVHLLPPDKPFIGAGIYALYYEGDFPLYADIAEQNRADQYRWPIYVGKAVPAGARKGGYGLDADPGQALYRRLAEHAGSINDAKNLNLADFRCRFLVVDDIWIPLAESLLVEMYSPLWNQKIDGFGNHDPGKGRYNQQRSPWDVIHPGRAWAYKLPCPSNDERIVREGAAAYITRTKIKIMARQADARDEE